MGHDGKIKCFTLCTDTAPTSTAIRLRPTRFTAHTKTYGATVVLGSATGKLLPATSLGTEDTADWSKRVHKQPIAATQQSTVTVESADVRVMPESTIKGKTFLFFLKHTKG